MGVNNRASVDPRWQKHHLVSLGGFKNAVVRILEPGLNALDTDYSAWTNAGQAAPTIVWQGLAQVQVFRQTLNAEVPGGAITQVRSLRFTVPMNGPIFPVRKGLQVRVVSCEGDDEVVRYQYTVTSGLGSGLGWDRTVEAEADMSVILPVP